MRAATVAKRKYTNWDQVPVTLTTKEVAEALGVHINTVKNLIASGELTYFRIGRAIRFNKIDVMKFAGLIPDNDK